MSDESKETETEAEVQEALDALAIADSIVHILSIYPILSPTMLQMGLGPQVKAGIWKPVLEELVTAGRVAVETETLRTPKGRYNTYTKIHLPSQASA